MSRILPVAGLLVLAALTGRAQQPSTQPQQPPLRSNANFVRVDVYPTQGGQSVTDLRVEDFELAEDGAPQAIQSFEHVAVTPAGPQEQRSEPSTIEQSQQLAANPRNRVFVLFLDVQHVQFDSSRRIQEPLIRLLDRVLGADDLVGIMTPDMSAGDLVLARKTQVIEGALRNRWPWGQRFTLEKSELETRYDKCYPPMLQDRQSGNLESPTVLEMIERRRERATLDALAELVQHMRGIREGRTAIVTVSEGWRLFRPNEALTHLRAEPFKTPLQEPMPGVDPVSVGPDGKMTTKNTRDSSALSTAECDADRMRLAAIDDQEYFRDIIGEANRASVSFYTVDPRGIAPFDTPVGPAPPLAPVADAQMLHRRQDSLRSLASGTDGIAIIQNNDLDGGLKRIAEDLTSYYLLGYYSTNTRLDGKFRSIKVRVTRPGVEVRSRNGYRAPTDAEVRSARGAAPPMAEPVPGITAALNTLARIRSDATFVVNAVPAGTAEKITTVWVAGELQALSSTAAWLKGSTVDLDVTVGGVTTNSRVTLAPGQRSFAAPVVLTTPAAYGPVDVRATLASADPDAGHLADRVRLDGSRGAAQPMIFRRGPSTANRLVPAASFQFTRTERAHLEFPAAAGVTASGARLLDKAGKVLAVPVTPGERTDEATGQRWVTAEVTFAALGAGDYAIELTLSGPAGEQRLISAVRVAK